MNTVYTAGAATSTTVARPRQSLRQKPFFWLSLLLMVVAGLIPPASAQTYLSEDFESGLPSANFAPDGGSGVQWTTNSTYFYGGAKSAYYRTVAGSANGYLVSKPFSLSSSSRPYLTFQHIVALERYYDQAMVEVTTDNGVTWNSLSNTQYYGNSWRKTGSNVQNSTTTTFCEGPYFDADSRPEWSVRFSSTSNSPVAGQSMWKKEVFDLSAYKQGSVRIRFRVKSNGSNDYYGWLLDNILVSEAPTTRIAGTRVIGTNGFANFSAAAQALADSGVGAGGVTFLVQPGTYVDSAQFGYWNGVSASNRVRFIANGGTVSIQRAGSSNNIGSPSYSGGYSYSYIFDAVLLMSGTQYVTLNGIRLEQQNLGASTPPYQTDIGLYMTNGCRFDSVTNCYMNLQSRYYTTTGFLLVSATQSTLPGLVNVGNRFINDTVVAWNGAVVSNNMSNVYDSLNEISGTSQGSSWFNLGPSTASYISTYSTQYGIQVYGEVGLTLKNLKLNETAYGVGLGYWTMYGIYSPGNLISPLITNNLIQGLGYNPASPTTGAQPVYALYMPGSNIYRPIITNNTISDIYEYYGYGLYLSGAHEPLVQGNSYLRVNGYYAPGYYGIAVTSCTRPRVIGNRIRDVKFGMFGGSTTTSTTTFYCMYLSGNTAPSSIYNNMISDVSMNNATTGNALYGMYLSPTAPPNSVSGVTTGAPIRDSICNNSMLFNSTIGSGLSTPAATTYAMYISPNSTTGMEMHLYNNLIVNRQTNGTGSLAYGIYRTSTAGSIFSDNNDLYVNTTGSGDNIHITGFTGSTSCYQLSDWRTNSPTGTDQHSFAELPSVTSDSLHIATGTATRLESAGRPLASVTDDFDGDLRGSNPDIGADEGSFTAGSSDDVGPAISYSKPSRAYTSTFTLSTMISDASGVATGSGTKPLLYYRAVGGTSWSTVAGSQGTGNVWTFTLPSQSNGTRLQYYLAAQDNASSPNVSTVPYGGSGTTPPGSTAPSSFDTLSFYTGGGLSGDYTVGRTTSSFTTLKAAIDAININGVAGPVRLLIDTNALVETGFLALQGPIVGSSATNTITIKPNTGRTPVITPQFASSYGIVLYGVSNVIIDGSNATNGTSRDMTIAGGTSSSTTTALQQVGVFTGLNLVDGVTPLNTTNVTVKNLVLRGGYPGSGTSSAVGVIIGHGVNPNSLMRDITVDNNMISQSSYGVRAITNSPEYFINPMHNVRITNNIMGPGTSGVDSLWLMGVQAQGVDSLMVDNNDIQRLRSGATANTMYGIQIFSGITSSSFTRNQIHNGVLQSTSGQLFGYQQSAAFPPSRCLIANNMIYDLHQVGSTYTSGTSSTAPAIAGIFITTGSYDRILNNSIYLFDTVSTTTTASTQYTEGVGFSTGAFGTVVANNIIVNGLVVGPVRGRNIAYQTYYGPTNVAFSNNNIVAAPGARGLLSYAGYWSQFITGMDSLRSYIGGDVNSWNQMPPFTSLTNPHLLTTVPTRAESGAIRFAEVPTDLDGDTRNATTPDIGADEGNFTVPTGIDIAISIIASPVADTKFPVGAGIRALGIVRNDGTTSAYNVPFTLRVVDSTTLVATTVSTTMDSLRAGETRTITMDSVTFTALHTYGLRLYSTASVDILRSNDSSTVTRVLTVPGLSGIYTVGVGRWAPTLKAAFDSLVNNGLGGPTTFQLTDANYEEASFTTSYIGSNGLILGANAGRRLRIKPAPGVSPVVNFHGSSARSMSTYYGTSYPGLGLINTSFLTIDGSNTENGTTRDMTLFMHPNTSSAHVLGFSSASFDSVKNCVIRDSTYYTGMTSSGISTWGILLSAPSSTVGSNSNVIQNNWIRDCYYGIYNYGVFGTMNQNNRFIGNKISRFTYAAIYNYYYTNNTLYQDNVIQSDTVAPVSSQYGFLKYGQYGTVTFDRNRIQRLRSSYSGVSMYGISDYYGGLTLTNNLIAIDHDTNTNNMYAYPLYQQYSGYSTYPLSNYYNNTIYVGGPTTTYYSSYMFYRYYSGGEVRNNVFIWDRQTYPSYWVYDYNYPNVPEAWSNNVYYKGSNAGGTHIYRYDGTTGTTYSSLASWQTAGFDLTSYTERQVFQDSINANFAPITTQATRIESHALPIEGVTKDINGNARDARYPDIGAYEGNYTSEFDVNIKAASFASPATLSHYFTTDVVSASATFQNTAILAASNVPVTYQAINPAGGVAATNTTSIASLAVSSSATASAFAFTPSTPGLWTIRAFATMPKDEYMIDDTVSIQINVTAGMAGNYNVGVGQYAPTIKAVYDSMTRNGVLGPLTFTLTDNSYSEPGLTPYIQWQQGSTGITFKPAVGANPVITVTPNATRPYGFRFNSMANVTFDGSNVAGGTTRNMTLQFSGGNNANGQAMFFAADSLGGNGNTNFTVKNLKIVGGGTGSTIYGFYAGGTSLTAAGQNSGVTVQNVEVRNAGVGMWVNGNANAGLTVTQSQFGPLPGDNTNRIGNTAIRVTNTSGAQITGNEITGLYSSANGVTGIELQAGTSNASLLRNKIHDMESFFGVGRAAGIVDNSGSATTIANNMIWKLISATTGTTASSATAGILLGSTTGDQLYYNSIYLTGNRDTTGPGATTGVSAAVYVTSSASAVTMKNNVLFNTQKEANNGAKSYAYVVESASTNVGAFDNNSVSATGTQGVMARVGTTDITRMQDLRPALGGSNELNGFGGIPPLNSETDLHVNPTVPSRLEGGATPIAGITDDIDGDLRNTTTPDVGADEGTFAKAVDVIAVSIDNPANNSVYRPFSKTTAPVVTFKNGATGTGTNIPVTLVTVDSIVNSRTVSNRTIPSLGPNQSVQMTFDSLILPDIGSYGLFAYSNYAFDVDNSNDTTSLIVVKVCAPMVGTYTVGNGRDFANLTTAAKTVRDCGIQSRVTLVLMDATYNEVAPISFSGITGMTSSHTLIVKPAPGVRPVMTIATATGVGYGIQLDSLNWVTFDGSNAANGTTRDWTVRLTGTNTSAAVIRIQDGSRDTVKNMVLQNVAMTSGIGVQIQPTRIPMTGVMVINNDIRNAQTGVALTAGGFTDSLTGLWRNTITRFSQTGIQIGDLSKAVMVRSNTIQSDTTTASTSMTGIAVSGAQTSNVEIGQNKIMDLTTSGTNPVLVGVSLSNTGTVSGSAALTATRLVDNMISLGRVTTQPTASMTGIQLNAGASAAIQNNTVAIGGSSVTSGSSYGFWVNAPANVTVVNNIVANTRTNGSSATGSHYSFFAANPPTGNLMMDYNDWYVSGTGTMMAQTMGVNQPTLAMWRMYTSGSAWGMQDRNSVSEAPNFVGTADLHITTVPSRIQNGGMPGTTVTTMLANGTLDYDVDGNPRAWTPDLGATEFDGPRNGRLAGSYVIGNGGTFATLLDAVTALNANGVDGAVDFYLANGTETYTSPIRFVAASGVSSTWPVRIHAAKNGSSTIVGLANITRDGGKGGSAQSLSNLGSVIIFDSAANNITFDGNNGLTTARSLTIMNGTTGSINGATFTNNAVLMTNGASSITVRNANLTTPAENRTTQPETFASDGWGVVTMLGGYYGGAVRANVIENDSIWNGWNGVYAASDVSNWQVVAPVVKKSRIQDFNGSGIYFGAGATNAVADGNYITTWSAPGAAPTVTGIHLAHDINAVSNTASNNWVIDVRSTGLSNVSGVEVKGGQKPFIYNNFISLADNTMGSVRGIDEASSSTSTNATGARIFHNSINLYGEKNVSSTNDYGLAIMSTDGIANGDSVLNNVIALQRANNGPNQVYAMGVSLATDASVVDNNDYYTPQGNVAMLATVSYPTLATLRAIPSWSTRDASSITGDPKFQSNTDLHIGSYQSALFNKAAFLASVRTDIDYQGRDAAGKIEIGADENGLFGALPVELMALEARGRDGKVDVTFQTANEKNVFGFAVLRGESKDNLMEVANATAVSSLLAHGSNGTTSDYSFTDANVTNGTTYYYKVVSIDNDGTRKEYDRLAAATPEAPKSFGISASYPNPFSMTENGATKISFSVGAASEKVELFVTDLTGRTVRSLVNGPVDNTGTMTTEWDAKSDDGTALSSGTYFVTLRAMVDGRLQTATSKISVTK